MACSRLFLEQFVLSMDYTNIVVKIWRIRFNVCKIQICFYAPILLSVKQQFINSYFTDK